MTIYLASLQSLDSRLPPQRLYSANRREASRNLAMLVREFGPKYAPYEARLMATDSGGWMVHRLADRNANA